MLCSGGRQTNDHTTYDRVLNLCAATPDIPEVKPTNVKLTSTLSSESDILVGSDSSILVGSAVSALEGFASEGFCTPQKTLMSVSVRMHHRIDRCG